MSRRTVRWTVSTCACLAAVGWGSAQVAHAQESGRVEAEALFDSALELMRAGEFKPACIKLEESQRVDPGVGTLLYLAECYEFDGRSASAWATYREAAAIAGAEGQAERARQGTQRASALEPRLSWVTLEMAPENGDIAGLTIRRGDVVVSANTWDTPLPVDPGEYEVVVTAPGYQSLTLPLQVGPDADRVALRVPALVEEPRVAPIPEATPSLAPARAPRAAEAAMDRQSPGRGHRAPAWIATGIGVAGLGVGSALGLVAMSRNDDAKRHCVGTVCDDPRGEALTEDAQTAARWSNVAFAIGAAGAVTAVVLWVTAPRHSRTTSAHVAPWVDPGGAAGVGARGRF